MSSIDWWVLSLTLAAIVIYGMWKSRGAKNIEGYIAFWRGVKVEV
jgi:hypothetical protein